MTLHLRKFATVATLMLAASTASAAVYNLSTEFSTTLNPNGVWTFGQSDVGSGFTTYPTQGSNGPLRSWENGSSVVFHNTAASVYDLTNARYLANTTYFHPGPSNSQDATIRFTAPQAGQYTLDADFWHADLGGDGANIAVYLNGVQQGATLAVTVYDPNAANPLDVIRMLSMAAGDRLDIALDNVGGYSFDAIGVRALITLADPAPPGIPEPASLALVALGLIAAGRRRKVA